MARREPLKSTELEALALDFMDHPEAIAALRTMAGGPHAHDAAVELGRLVKPGHGALQTTKLNGFDQRSQ